ncbi:DUF1566 domain-containing protein [Flavobacteriales bacterium]|nr:DUF1566 domain-containing protein [Flavobacteriales bacterium]
MKKLLSILLFVPLALFGQTSFEDLIENTSLNEGLISFYPFNDNANDVSGNENHGVVYEAQLSPDRFGNQNSTYKFDVSDATGWGNADDRIDVNYNEIMLSNEISLSAWVNPDYKNPPFENRPLTICSRWTVFNSESFRFQIGYDTNELSLTLKGANDNYSLSGGTVPYNEWSFVSATYDGDIVKLYVDGQLVNEEYLGINLSQGTSDFTIGETEMYNGHWYYWSGYLDDIGYWNRALTSEEVELLYMGVLSGCTDSTAFNYNVDANTDDGSCLTLEEYTIDSLEMANQALLEESSLALSSLQQALDTWNTTIDLSAGWNMFGYGCPTSIDLVQGLSNHTELIAMVKDNNGSAYIPEFGFNGIGDLTPGFGYQIKVTESIEDFSLCDWYVNDIPEDNIVSLQEENASLQAELDSIYGCVNENACNFDALAAIDDGSCYNNDLGCGCDTPGPIEGLDCEGNELTQYQVGDFAEGGIVFYVDETGEHGLVAAMEDLTEGATDPYGYGFNGYEWGCYQIDVIGADGQAIGTGYQNTMDIVNQGCSTENGGITAAQAALDAEIDGYSDWYLPSMDELVEIYNTIGNGGSEVNIGGFESDYYYSSSENYNSYAWTVYFSNGNSYLNSKYLATRVRVIRAF